MDELLQDFLAETGESLEVVGFELVRFEREPRNAQILANIFRLVHTIKGTCGFLTLPRLAALTHAAENLIGRLREGAPATAETITAILRTIDRIRILLDALEKSECEPEGDDTDLIADLDRLAAAALSAPAAARETPDRLGAADMSDAKAEESDASQRSIRVNVETLDALMTTVSELVLTRNQILETARQRGNAELDAPLQRLSNVTAALQDSVMKARMQPIGNAWQKLPRIVRDVAAALGKQIAFEMQGVETELDRQMLDWIRDPLTHMVRNAVDHGIESPAERIKAGKPEKGAIRLAARQESGHVVIEIADDGRGVDVAKVKAKLLAGGRFTPRQLETMSDAQLVKHIFTPGFSTAGEVTRVSGRGVGLDVVRNNIDRIGGSIEVKSVAGAGSSFIIRIPITLAIIPSLIVETDRERFAIPQFVVAELVRIGGNSGRRIEQIKDACVLRLRNKLLPVVHLRALLGAAAAIAHGAKGFVIVVQVDNRAFGVVVEGVLQTEEIVVKPMPAKLRQIKLFAGNTILGDGSVVMIIDPNGLADAAGCSISTESMEDPQAAADALAESRSRVPLLLFRAGGPQLKAVPLPLVVRLEEVDCARIERADGRCLLQYRGQLMPLLPCGHDVKPKDEGTQPLLVFSNHGRNAGLMVDEIVDIIDDRLDIDVAGEQPGLLGCGVIRGEATEIIDVDHFLKRAFGDLFRREETRIAEGRSLLLVDDSAFFRNMLTPILARTGYAVTAVEGARAALAEIEAGRAFDLIVTDLDMPEMDGFALLAALRDKPGARRVPVIALSAAASPETVARARKAHFEDCVAKFDRTRLIASLKEQSACIGEAA
ncbi:MAG: chemotaxis protein CheW [Pseudorhodoplanes sp.]